MLASSAWRRNIKTALRHFGYELTRFHPESSAAAQVAAVLRHLHTDLVLDVGANRASTGCRCVAWATAEGCCPLSR